LLLINPVSFYKYVTYTILDVTWFKVRAKVLHLLSFKNLRRSSYQQYSIDYQHI